MRPQQQQQQRPLVRNDGHMALANLLQRMSGSRGYTNQSSPPPVAPPAAVPAPATQRVQTESSSDRLTTLEAIR